MEQLATIAATGAIIGLYVIFWAFTSTLLWAFADAVTTAASNGRKNLLPRSRAALVNGLAVLTAVGSVGSLLIASA